MKNFLQKYWVILLIGLIIRILVASVTFHPDVRTTALASASVLQSRNLDFYNQAQCIAPQEVLDDLPVSYLISLPIHFVFRPLVNSETEFAFLNHQETLFGNPQIWVYLLYTKLPLILFDLGLAVLLFFAFNKKTFVIWLFNPFTLWATSAIGQVDIYPTFFIVLAYLFLKKDKLNWASLALGVGGAIKSSPFLLVPILLGTAHSWKQRFQIILLALVPYLLTVIPYLPNRTFRANALFAPQLSKMLYARLPLSGGESLLIVPTLLLVIYFIYLSKKRDLKDFLNFSVIILLTVLSLTHFHLQWFLWVMPLLLIWVNNRWQQLLLPILGLTISLVGMMSLFDASLQVKLFAPLIPQLDQMKGAAEILSTEQVTLFRSLFASLFAASSGFIIWRMIKGE